VLPFAHFEPPSHTSKLTKKGVFVRNQSIVVILALALSGCAAPKPGTPEAVANNEIKREKKAVETVQKSIQELPEWFTEAPVSETHLYDVATSTSSDLQMALDKAILDAKYRLADRLRSQMSGKMKRFVEETGGAKDPQLLQETSKVISNMFTDVNAAGYRVSKKKITPQGEGYRAYVLLEYPIGEANKVLAQDIKSNQIVEARVRASAAFAELEASIKTSREVGQAKPSEPPANTTEKK
jgi:hypothetical protein